MKKLIVPTDFSDTSKNAAMFAAKMANDIYGCSIILYNVFDSIFTSQEGTSVFSDIDSRKKIAESALANLKFSMEQVTNAPIEILAEEGQLIPNLEKICHHQQAEMIIMGITGATRLDQILMGSNTLKLIEQHICPVMIIPPDAVYRKIKTAIFASDFKNVETSTPIITLRKLLDLFKPVLHVVHVGNDASIEQTEEFKSEKVKLNKMLAGLEPEYDFIIMQDFAEAINQFAKEQDADLIITVPKKHGFLSGLFKTSHTKKLAYHSHIPILAVQE